MNYFFPTREELIANPPPAIGPRATGEVASFGESVGAGFTAHALEINYNDQEGQTKANIVRNLTDILGADNWVPLLEPSKYVVNGAPDQVDPRQALQWTLQAGSPQLENYGSSNRFNTFADKLFAEITRLKAEDPVRWQQLEITSRDQLDAEVIRTRKAEYQDAQATLAMGGVGSGVAGFLGSAAAEMSDPRFAPLMVLGSGAGMGIKATIAAEAAMGGLGAAAVLPSMYDQAEKLDIPDPNAVAEIAMGAALGGGLAGVIGGVVAGARRFGLYRAGRNQMQADSTAAGEALARETEAALAAGEPIPQVPDLTQAESWRNAIAAVESRGSGDYSATGPIMASGSYAGDRAYGRYQIMGRNIPAWSKQYLGREMTIDEFMANPAKQDELFDAVFGSYVNKWGNPQDAASVWFTGRPLSEGGNRSDGFITGNEYVNRFTSALDNPQSDAPRPSGGGADIPTGTRAGYTAPDQVVTPSGTRIDVAYEVVDASLLTRASGELQPRDRTRAASDAQITQIAAQLDPARLMPSAEADRGAPIIGPDNVIESGNGRVAAIQQAAPDRKAAYRAAITEAGFDIPEGIKEPVLVARRTSQLDQAGRVAFVNDANTSSIARMSATEQAAQDARGLSSHTMAQYAPGKAISAPENTTFTRAFLEGMPANERAALTTAEGRLNIDGERRLKQALFARAYGAPDLIAKHTEASDPAMRSLIDALAEAAPQWSALRADIEAGLIKPEMDLTDNLLDAVRLIGDARKTAAKGKTDTAGAIDDALAQISLEGQIHPLTEALVQIFRRGDRVRPDREITELLTGYTNEARIVGKTDAALFDTELSSGPMEVLDAIQKETDLFAPGGPGTRPRDEGLYRQPNRPNLEGRSREAREPLDTSQADEAGYIDGAQSEGSIAADAQGVADLRAATTLDFETISQMPDVAAALDDMAAIPRTDMAPNYGTPEYWAEREFNLNGKKALGKDSAIDYLNGVARTLAWTEDGLTPPKKLKTERQATIIIGAPASGKSTVANPIARDLGAAIVDADEAKKIIPEFGDGVGANAVHRESSDIARTLLADVIADGTNVVLPKVGKSAASIEELVTLLRGSKYEVSLVYVDVAPQQAWERMIGRYRNTGRIINPNYMRDAIDAPRQTYQTLKENRNADRYAQIDNSPALGQPRGIIEDPNQILPGELAKHRGNGPDRDGLRQSGSLEAGTSRSARTQSPPRQESQVAAARASLTEDFELVAPDGTTMRASELLDDIEADSELANIINLCNPKGGA